MRSQQIIDTLENMFAKAGYRVTPSRHADFMAVKGVDRRYVKYLNSTTQSEVNMLIDTSRQLDGNLLIVSSKHFQEGIQRAAQRNNVLLWDRNDLASRIGSAILSDMDGSPINLSFDNADVNRTGGSPFRRDENPFKRDEYESAESTGFGSFFGMASSPAYESPRTPSQSPFQRNTSTTSTAPAYESPRTPSQSPFQRRSAPTTPTAPTIERSYERHDQGVELKINSFPVLLNRSDVLAIAKGRVSYPDDPKLRFIPFWRYEYSLEVEKTYKSRIISLKGDGDVDVNALTGEILKTPSSSIHNSVMVPDEEYAIEKPIMVKEKADETAMDRIVSDHTKKTKFDRNIREAMISDYKTFKPSEKEITVTSSLAYLPVWVVEGDNAILTLNASTGEEITQPIDGDAEIF